MDSTTQQGKRSAPKLLAQPKKSETDATEKYQKQ